MSFERVSGRHWLDLPWRGRAAFATAYLAAQVSLIVLGLRAPDRVFAFQMFNESSTLNIHLSRQVRAPDGSVRLLATDGSWVAGGRGGAPRAHAWGERVRDGILGRLDQPVAASYGVDAQMFRLQRALDDVASHLHDDAETVAFVADVKVWKNGRGPSHVRLQSTSVSP